MSAEIAAAARECGAALNDGAQAADTAVNAVEVNAPLMLSAVELLTRGLSILEDIRLNATGAQEDAYIAVDALERARDAIQPYGFHDSSRETVQQMPGAIAEMMEPARQVKKLSNDVEVGKMGVIIDHCSAALRGLIEVRGDWSAVNNQTTVHELPERMQAVAQNAETYAADLENHPPTQ